jgi:Holliday junction resolvasome RuvABC endonuclease subunit
MSIVAGIDPSVTSTGIATPDWLRTVGGDAKVGDRRLEIIFDAMLEVVALNPVLVMVEDLPTHAQGAGKTGMSQGVVRLALVIGGIRYVLVTPASVKMFATGKGNATKSDMRMEIFKRTGVDIRDDNQADAWWLRQLGLQHLGECELGLPKKNLSALDAIVW